MSVLSQKPGFLQPQKTEADSHLPKEGCGIMLPPLPFLSLFGFLFAQSCLHPWPHSNPILTTQVQVTETQLKLAFNPNEMFGFI